MKKIIAYYIAIIFVLLTGTQALWAQDELQSKALKALKWTLENAPNSGTQNSESAALNEKYGIPKYIVGKSCLGYTYCGEYVEEKKFADKEHQYFRWCKVIEDRTTDFWDSHYSDDNYNGKKDPEEIRAWAHYIWYNADATIFIADQYDKPNTDGSFPSCIDTVERSFRNDLNAVKVDIGDLAMASGSKCYVAKGPLVYKVEVSALWQLGNNIPKRLEGPDSWIYLSASGDHFTDSDKMIASLNKAMDSTHNEAIALASAFAAGLPWGKMEPKTDNPMQKPAVITLNAFPENAWADGITPIKLKIRAVGNDGKPLKGAAFDITVADNLLGECKQVKFITDKSGTDSAEYVAINAGQSTLTAKGNAGSASVTIGQGGLVIKTDNPGKTQVLADGKSGLGLSVMCINPKGNPQSGVKISIDLSANNSPASGSLDKQSLVTGSDGVAKFIYTAPTIDPTSGTRAADVYANASASVGNPIKTIKSSERISLYAGECIYLAVEKPGFAKLEKYAASVQMRNGMLSGFVTTKSDSGADLAVNCAKLSIASSDGKELASGLTSFDGKFEIKFVGDPTNPADMANQLPKPIELKINSDLANRIAECRKDLKELSDRNYDVASTADFMDSFAENLAKSIYSGIGQNSAAETPVPKKKSGGLLGALDKLSAGLDRLSKKLDIISGTAPDKLSSTDYLINVCPRLAWACRYANLVNERQCETVDWLSDNIKGGLGDAMDVFSITDKIHDAAKNKLKDKFAAPEWEKYRENVLADFLGIMYDQFQKGVDMAKTMNYDTGDIENYKKFGVEWTSKKTVDGITDGLKFTIQRLSHSATQEMLTKAGGAALRGDMTGDDYRADAEKALDIFTTFEMEHNKQNIKNCNAELYRLDTKLFMDTFVKGPMIYLNLKKVIMNPETLSKIAELDTKSLEDIQDTFIKNGDLASKMSSAVDSAFQSYQGYNWIIDYTRASSVRDELKKLLLR